VFALIIGRRKRDVSGRERDGHPGQLALIIAGLDA
jgi:hypothetical protein